MSEQLQKENGRGTFGGIMAIQEESQPVRLAQKHFSGHNQKLCMDENGVGAWATRSIPTLGLSEKDVSGHNYFICHEENPWTDTLIRFQNGPIKEVGVNGITSEALLVVLLDRTKVLNERFPCKENEEAIEHMQKALDAFYARTANRKARGVEGSNKA